MLPPYMPPPAWRVSFLVRAVDRAGMVVGWTWTGTVSDARFELTGPPSSLPDATGLVIVTSWRPLRADAIEDAARAARDVLNICGVRKQGVQFVFDLPPHDVTALQGGFATGGVSVSGTLTIKGVEDLSSQAALLAAAERIAGDPGLRANVDTWMVAQQQEDAGSRAINLHRIFEGHADEMLDGEPRLLDDAKVDEILATLTGALSESLAPSDTDRVRSLVGGSLRRVRVRARSDVLAQGLSELLQRPIDAPTARQLVDHRAHVAHKATQHQAAPADNTLEQLLFESVTTRLQRDLAGP